MIEKLKNRLDILFEFLYEQGEFQCKRQKEVSAIVKSNAF